MNPINLLLSLLLLYCSIINISAQSHIITSGLGVKGFIEIGKTVKQNQATAGRGIINKESIRGGCIRVKGHKWVSYLYYPQYGVKAYIDRHIYSKKKNKQVNWICFGSTFKGGLENGITIGKTTRKEIYELYGRKEYDNPGIQYISLGIGFVFDNTEVDGNETDILKEIEVFEPRIEK